MERLTEKELYDGKVCYTKCSKTNCKEKCCDCPVEQEIPFRLKSYEDAEEQGLLLRLPFLPKPGMKIYDIYGCIENGESEPREITIRSFDITHARMWLFHINQEVFTFDEFGKTYFLTREESALAEKGGV